MRRLLFVGLEVANFSSTTWTDWLSASPLDYQGLVLNLGELPSVVETNKILGILNTLSRNQHSIYVLLPNSENAHRTSYPVNWIPDHLLYVSKKNGQTLKVVSGNAFFKSYSGLMVGHEICFDLKGSVQRSYTFEPGIVDNVSALLCARYGNIYVLHPPPKRSEQKAIKLIIEHFKPDVILSSTKPKPSWVDEIASSLPGVATAQASLTSIAKEIEIKNEQLQQQGEELKRLASWTDLLCEEGQALQNKVEDALKLLGVNVSSDDPTGHSCDLSAVEGDLEFVFEVTGTSGSIGIGKGRQLMQWVADTDDPSRAKGVLVANAFRNEHPDNRPPSPDHRIFVTEVESLAAKYHLALLDVRELYRTVSAKLSGKEVSREIIVEGLKTDGIVRFNVE